MAFVMSLMNIANKRGPGCNLCGVPGDTKILRIMNYHLSVA